MTDGNRVPMRMLGLVLAAALLVGALPAAAMASDGADAPPTNEPPPLSELPVGLAPPGYGVGQPACPSGNDRCVDVVTAEMARHLEARGCDHNAVFALLYLRTTEGIRDHIRAGHFLDRPLLNREATAFARYYLDAFSAWERGHTSRVPAAWRMAFEAAADRELHTFGNMFLGINAHVNRDLPFVLYRLGMVGDDAGYDARYEDHGRVNAVLTATRPVAFPQIGLTLDRTIFDPSLLPAMAPDLTDPLLVPTWRQHAWEQAERLAAAPDAAARAAVAADIEAHAAAVAEGIIAATRYDAVVRDGVSADLRDAYCAAQRG